jgi:acylphosphatase
MNSNKKHLDITISGKVQGVHYRASTKAVADQLGITGTVKNTDDGDVVIAAEGTGVMLGMFMDWCNEGPEGAEVTSVESHEGELKNYRNFEVIKKKSL